MELWRERLSQEQGASLHNKCRGGYGCYNRNSYSHCQLENYAGELLTGNKPVFVSVL